MFVALIAFDLKLGIVATSAPNATFDENRNLLLEVMQSVSIPAGQPPTTDPGTTGLGQGFHILKGEASKVKAWFG